MKKNAFIGFVLCLVPHIGIAQVEWRVNFVTDTTKILETGINYAIQIEYTIEKLVASATNSTIDIEISDLNKIIKNNALKTLDYNFSNATIPLNDASHPLGTVQVHNIPFEILSDDIDEKPEIIYLEIEFSDPKIESLKNYTAIEISEFEVGANLDPDDPFRIAIGANFDFLEGVSSTNLFSEVNFTNRDIFDRNKTKWKTKEKEKILGITFKRTREIDRIKRIVYGLEAGYYQNRSFGTPLENRSISNQHVTIKNLGVDSTVVYFNSLREVQSDRFDNLGLYFSPTRELIRKQNLEKKDLFVVHFGAHFEVVKRVRTRNFSNEIITLDSTLFSNDSLATVFTEYFPARERADRSIQETKYDRFYGISLPIFYSNSTAEFYFKFSSGWGEFGFDELPSSKKQALDNFYYITQFKVIEKQFGLQLSGDFRGFFTRNDYNSISISLSKIFDLSKLLTY